MVIVGCMNGDQCLSRMSARTRPTYFCLSLSRPSVETRAASATVRSLPMWLMSVTPISVEYSIIWSFRVCVQTGRVFENVEHPPFVELSINQNGALVWLFDAAHGSDCCWVG